MIAFIDCQWFRWREVSVYMVSEEHACVQQTVFWIMKSHEV